MNRFVYRKPFFFWLSVLVACGLFFAVKSQLASTSEADELKTLVESSPHKMRREKRKTAHELTEQMRYGVTKQIYIAEGPLRRQFDIRADRSKIAVISQKPHMHVTETFYNAAGYLQQELFYVTPDGDEVIYDETGKLAFREKKHANIDVESLRPKQLFRYFEADEAVYDFQTHQLLATGCKFWTYIADGHDVVHNPHEQEPHGVGSAGRMAFYVSGPNSKEQFSAENVKVWFSR